MFLTRRIVNRKAKKVERKKVKGKEKEKVRGKEKEKVTGRLNMNNLTKVLIALLFLMIAAGIILAGINYVSFDSYHDSVYAEQEVTVWGDEPLNAFVSESESYEDRFVFNYIPRDQNAALDYYLSYEFKQDGTTLESEDKKLYENVTASDPIVLEFPRVEGSTYELNVTIEDTGGVILHKSGMTVYPPKHGNESEM